MRRGEVNASSSAERWAVSSSARAFSDNGEQRGLVQFLQEACPSGCQAPGRRRPGGAVEVRGGYAAHPVGHPGPAVRPPSSHA